MNRHHYRVFIERTFGTQVSADPSLEILMPIGELALEGSSRGLPKRLNRMVKHLVRSLPRRQSPCRHGYLSLKKLQRLVDQHKGPMDEGCAFACCYNLRSLLRLVKSLEGDHQKRATRIIIVDVCEKKSAK